MSPLSHYITSYEMQKSTAYPSFHPLLLFYIYIYIYIFDPLSNMTSMANEITRVGGEGVILRRPQSIYQQGVSQFLLLYKMLMTNCNLAIVKSQFKTASDRRRFFDQFAESRDFHPLDAEKWYAVTKNKIRLAVT
jgi:hypothetical protein